jgi:hypothetical protein
MKRPRVGINAAVKARAFRRGYAKAAGQLVGNLLAAGLVRYRHAKQLRQWQADVDAWAHSANLANALEPPPRPNLRES